MYDYIKGQIAQINPTEVVLDNNGIGYLLQISLQTYSDIQNLQEVKLYTYHHVREDIELLYGFFKKEERSLFLMLIEVNGIGPNTARMMLSSLTYDELRGAILSEDVNKIKSIKGIGLKSAQRVIIELKDKIIKGGGETNSALSGILSSSTSVTESEALSALVLLGFPKPAAQKAIAAVGKEKPGCSLEELIKLSLKKL